MLTHFDCFAGPGGITTGFSAAGIQTVGGVEKVASCAETFSHNHPDVHMFNLDIRKLSKNELNKAGIKKVDVVTAGMPCETFSTAGSTSRSFYDDRQMLFNEGIRLASLLDARLILLENVPAITSKRLSKETDELVIDKIYESLSAAGYKYFIDTILDSSDFGIPQKRKRFFIAASREKLPLAPPLSKKNGGVTVAEAFSDLPAIEANSGESFSYQGRLSSYARLMRNTSFWLGDEGHPQTKKLTYHIAPKHRNATIERFRLIKPGEGLKDLFDKLPNHRIQVLQRKKVLPKKWYIQRNRRLLRDAPSPTVTSHCLDELIHPSVDRALTVREVARLQSFPDHYEFVGGPLLCPHVYETQDKYEQVGDAVPPLLAYHWGIKIRNVLGDLPVVV